MVTAVKFAAAFSIALMGAPLMAESARPRYSEGQVWEYKARPQDAGSLLKIQKIGMDGDRKVYHLSVRGLRFGDPKVAGILPHIPVSGETLDLSVTKLSASARDWPASIIDEGMAEWARARGGVFTIPVARIVDIVDQQITAAALGNQGER